MRKRNTGITITLAILVIISFIFSYFILYDISSFESLIGNSQQASEEELPAEALRQTPSIFNQTTTLSFQDVTIADNYLVRLGQQSYIIQDKSTVNTLRSLIESRPFNLTDIEEHQDESMINNLLDIDHLQLELVTSMPLNAHTRMLNIEDDVNADMLIDRIIIPLTSQEDTSVYFVDAATDTYYIGNLSKNLTKEELRNAISLETSDLLEVIRYSGVNKPIYLPVNELTLPSELFTLEMIRENLYISEIFTMGDSNTTDVSRNDETIVRFQNYLNTLEVNRTRQRLTLTIGRADPSEARTQTEKLRNAYSIVQDFEYWDGDLRLFSSRNNYITFRRYYNNLPILTKSTLTDYGANIVQLRSDLSGDIYRYYQPMVTVYTHINTKSEDHVLINHDQIYASLQELGYSIDSFDNIFIGYEWQEDMEGFKKVELIPTWFFKLGAQYYTLEEVMEDSFYNIWQDYQNSINASTEGSDD
ncbi:two-component system activity regulator YycH [Aerococcaceae bacterium WGS1372]